MAVLRRMPTIYSTRNARLFKLNDLHISTSLFSVMTDMSRDSVVDRHCLRQGYVPYVVNSRLNRLRLAKVIVKNKMSRFLWFDV